MPSPPLIFNANDIIETQILGKMYGEPNMIVVHWRAKQASTPAGGFANHLSGFINSVMNCCTNFQQWHKWRYRRLRPLPVTDYGEIVLATGWVGWSGGTMPAQMCHLIKLHTLLKTQSGKGRIYVPAVPLSHWTDNMWNNNGVTGPLNFCNFIKQWFKVGGQSEWMELGVVSRLTTPIIYNGVTDATFASYPAVRRSRRPVLF